MQSENVTFSCLSLMCMDIDINKEIDLDAPLYHFRQFI